MAKYNIKRNSGGQGADNWHIDGTCDVHSNGIFNIEPGGEFQIDGETVDATAAEMNTRYLHIHIDDVSTLDSNGLVYCPFSGTVTKIKSVLGASVSVADATITAKINTVNITDGALIVANGSVKGDIITATPTAANTVTEGDYLEAISDGGSTGAATLDVTFKIEL